MNPAVVIGECMVEVSLGADAQAVIGFAGDTFNTAIYLQRLGIQTVYATAIGQGDPFSDGILDRIAAEGVGRGLLVEAPGRLPGLYAIETDARGERRFYYWRDASPARDYMRLVDLPVLQQAIKLAPLVYVSAITLAILGDRGRAQLTEMLSLAAASGVAVALDTNYRARLWSDPQIARTAVEAVAPLCRYLSISAEDLDGMGLDASACAQTWSAAAEVVLRKADGSVEVLGPEVGALPPPSAMSVVDTTGAGDAFNAGYLASRLRGRTVAEALNTARQLAQAVVGHRGAIIPKEAMP